MIGVGLTAATRVEIALKPAERLLSRWTRNNVPMSNSSEISPLRRSRQRAHAAEYVTKKYFRGSEGQLEGAFGSRRSCRRRGREVYSRPLPQQALNSGRGSRVEGRRYPRSRGANGRLQATAAGVSRSALGGRCVEARREDGDTSEMGIEEMSNVSDVDVEVRRGWS